VQVHARCAQEDREALLGTAMHYVSGRTTACFEFSYEGDRRKMAVVAVGDVWEPEDVPALDEVDWVHVAPLLRSDFPTETVGAIAAGRRVLLDGQGLVRVSRVGALVLDADFDPGLLRHVAALKLAEEEAEVLGDPAALPVGEVLVTHGSRGATVYVDGRSTRISTDPVDADPTGSGDMFAISYVAARAAGHAPVDAARSAAGVVSAVLRER
jgi:sugar/nucleoside kinase (ribokinase family)